MARISEFDRRKFIKYLAASPFMLSVLPKEGRSQGARQVGSLEGPNGYYKDDNEQVITLANQAINVFDFEAAARRVLPPAHFGYLSTGVDDDATLIANCESYSKWQIKMRRLVDISHLDTSVNLFGEHWDTPIILAPIGSQGAFHAEGELATVKAAKRNGHLAISSTMTSHSIANINEAYGRPSWFQLYAGDKWEATEKVIERAEKAGSNVIVLTVDLFGGSNRETLKRYKNLDIRNCDSCHQYGFGNKEALAHKANLIGLDYAIPQFLTWQTVTRIKNRTTSKLLIKGIVTAEDAKLCLKYGADGIIVSNHGGRAAESGRASLDSLQDVVKAVKGKVPVLMDGGIRRGTDIFKALALGADAVCIGRPYAWGLASFGEKGVETVLSLLRAELELIMRKAGTTTISDISRDYLS